MLENERALRRQSTGCSICFATYVNLCPRPGGTTKSTPSRLAAAANAARVAQHGSARDPRARRLLTHERPSSPQPSTGPRGASAVELTAFRTRGSAGRSAPPRLGNADRLRRSVRRTKNNVHDPLSYRSTEGPTPDDGSLASIAQQRYWVAPRARLARFQFLPTQRGSSSVVPLFSLTQRHDY
jgi:hypothetical protein